MTDSATESPASSKAPWHLWVVGVVSLLWNAAGAYVFVSAQAGLLPGIEPAEAAYYAGQPQWFVVVTDIALFAAIAAALALLLRNRFAVRLYWLSIAAIVVTAAYDLGMGPAYILTDQGALIATLCIWALSGLQLWYATAMQRRGVLR